MPQDIIAVVNQKGGVGKSTTAHALGIGLANKGFRVLFIDLDGQGNLSYMLNADMQKSSVLDVLTRKAKINDVLQHCQRADLIPSSPMLAGADNIITATGKEYRLKEVLESIISEYDYIIIDTPPSLGILVINALTLAYSAIITAQADIFSLQGISQVNETINTVKQYCNNALKIGGILLTRFNERALISRDIADTLRKIASQLKTKLYKATIRENIAIKEAQSARQDIYAYAPNSNGARDYQEFVDEYISQSQGVINERL
ncbi:chromosome partitioning protein ParA [Endomicrobiia bacterium]|nr:chromosome partitioning protein ParA [Endomicrobiia bacterium]